jgi:hypothetical protein
MKRELTTQVGADGVLVLQLPLGSSAANRTVRVVVETVEGPGMTQEEWRRFIRDMAGRITDPTFDRQPQGNYEVRNELS